MKAWLIFLCLTTAVLSSFSQEVADGTSSPPHAETEDAAPPPGGGQRSMKLVNFHLYQVINETEDDRGEELRQGGEQEEEDHEEEDAAFWQATNETIGDDKNDTTSDPAYSPEGLNATEPPPEVQTTAGPTTAPTPAVTTADDSCLSRKCQASMNPWAACTGSTPEDEGMLSQSLSEFTVEFYKAAIRQAKAHSNLVFSPLSVSVMFSNLLLGACGETKARLETLLFYPQEFTCVHSALGSLSKSKTLNSANAVFFPPQLTLNSVFENLTKTFYQTKMKHLTNNSNQDVIDINVWVSQATNHKIKKLLDTLDPDVQMVLLNAVYFQSKWKTLFKEKNTKEEQFYREGLPPIKVPMMISKKYPVASYFDHHLQAKVAQLELENNMHLVIILPRSLSESLSETEGRLSAPVIVSMLARLKNIPFKPTIITLPKFKVESSQDLMEIAGEMDYGVFFDTDLCRVSDKEEIMVSGAHHKAMMEINEEGVTAAAATSISLARIAHFLEVQQPFIFLVVYDNGIIAFMGRVHNPQTP